jgi:hypothetical protein
LKGSAANLNVHLHCLVLGGVWLRGVDRVQEFVEVPEPTDEALQAVLHKIITRKLKTPWRDGPAGRGLSTTHLVMSPLAFMQRLAPLAFMQRLAPLAFMQRLAPLAFMQRLAPLVARPRLHLFRLLSA